MNDLRAFHCAVAMTELSDIQFPSIKGRNGEELATDEASLWKRVINRRVTRFMQPASILETHPGLGISTLIYKDGAPDAQYLSYGNGASKAELIDIDPFGQPWDDLEKVQKQIDPEKTCLLVTSGEIYCVIRKFHKSLRHATKVYGSQAPSWVVKEYIPNLTSMTGLNCQFFYAFPTSVRCVLCNKYLPKRLWKGCPQWMWWLSPERART